MSKSYGNTIPLFIPEDQLKKLVRSILTDSTPVAAPKDPESSSVFLLLEHFGAADVVEETRRQLGVGGLGWGEVKNRLFDVLADLVAPMRERYDALLQTGSELDDILATGAERARKRAAAVLDQVRRAVGV